VLCATYESRQSGAVPTDVMTLSVGMVSEYDQLCQTDDIYMLHSVSLSYRVCLSRVVKPCMEGGKRGYGVDVKRRTGGVRWPGMRRAE